MRPRNGEIASDGPGDEPHPALADADDAVLAARGAQAGRAARRRPRPRARRGPRRAGRRRVRALDPRLERRACRSTVSRSSTASPPAASAAARPSAVSAVVCEGSRRRSSAVVAVGDAVVEGDEVGDDDAPAGAADPGELGQRGRRVGEVVDDEAAEHRVERAVRERQVLERGADEQDVGDAVALGGVAADVAQRVGEVGDDELPRAARQRAREVAGAAARVEDDLVRARAARRRRSTRRRGARRRTSRGGRSRRPGGRTRGGRRRGGRAPWPARDATRSGSRRRARS